MVATATISVILREVRPQPKHDPRTEQQEDEQLRALVQQFVRRFGLLVTRRTPCGLPVSPSYAHALMVLLRREREGIATLQSDLAGTLGIDKSNVARLCERMARAGHAVQTIPPEDGRSRVVALTAKGTRLAERIENGSRDRFSSLTASIPRNKRGAVIAALADLNAAVETIAEGDDLEDVVPIFSTIAWLAGCQRPAVTAATPGPPSAAALLDSMDTRVPVPLLPMMANHQKQNMRDHLHAVQEIVGAVGVSG